MKKTFTLVENAEYIELVKLLKLLHVTETGGDGKEMIRDGLVLVNNEVDLRVKRKLRTGDVVLVPDLDVEITIE